MSPRTRRRPSPFRAGCGGAAVVAVTLAAALGSAARAQAPPVTPQDFVSQAGGSDQYEIMAARLTLVESRDPAIRAFATEMIRDHTASEARLRQATSRSGLKPPSSSVGGDQAALLAALQGVRGAAYDRLYTRQQRLAHLQALTTVSGYLRNGSDPNLRAAAQADVPMIEHHLQEVGGLQPRS